MRRFNKTHVLLMVSLASFLTPFMSASVQVALPRIAEDFAANAVVLNWIATSYLLASALFIVPFGRLSDIIGRKKVFFWGITIFTVASLLSAFATSASMLILIRVIQGLGSSMTYGTGLAMLTAVFQKGERGRAIGINVTSVYIGLTMGPVIGGFLTGQFGWRSIFLFLVPVGLLTMYFTSRVRMDWVEAKDESFDWFGSLIYGASLTILLYSFSMLPDFTGLLLIFASIIGFIIFIIYEQRIKHPVLNLNLFKNKAFSLSSLAALINYSAIFAVAFLISLYLQYIKGMSPQQAGVILITQPIIMAVLSPFMGKLSDKIEPQKMASIGMGITTLGLVVLSTLGFDSSLIVIIFGLFLIGLGFAIFSSPNMNAIMSSIEKKHHGVGAGILATMRLLGQTFSMGIVMILFTVLIGAVQITPLQYPAFLVVSKTTYYISVALCIVGILASLARGKIHS